jgi:DNA-binding NarL/FixJ family response regulator
MIRVFICDDQTIVCDGLEAILSRAPDIEVVGIAHDGAEALEKIPQAKPDVVLMDLKMPGMNGIQATRKITAQYPEVKVLVLTTFGADEWVFDAIRNGASGYLLKGSPKEDLIKAVKGTAAGETHIDPSVGGKLFSHIARSTVPQRTTVTESLSERELEVLRLLASGLTNTEIAQKLFLSEGTVRNYVSTIFTKLDVTDRTQAAILALRHGIADINNYPD